MRDARPDLIQAQKASPVWVVVSGLYPQKALADAFRLAEIRLDLEEEQQHSVSALLDETSHPSSLVRFDLSRGSSDRTGVLQS